MPRAVLHQVSLTFTVRCKVTLTCTVRHTQVRCTPLLQASGGQEQYYIRSAWHLQSDILRSDVPPTRGIWWPRAVLHQVSLTFTVGCNVSLTFAVRHTQVRCNPPVQASSGQEQYYVRSAWHLVILWVTLSLSQMCYSVYISSWIDQDIYVEWSFCCVCCCSCCCCCYCIILFLQQQENYTLKRTATRTKRSTYIHFLFNYQ